jgi:hypothetical protein
MSTGLLWDEPKLFESWRLAKDFLRTLRDRYVFRGMASADWKLETTRDRKARFHRVDSEAILGKAFQAEARVVDADAPPRDDPLSWRALMRHYGLPSRLLDCTRSPDVAAYFAAAPVEACCCSLAVWAFEEDALQSWQGGVVIGPRISPRELARPDLFAATFGNPRPFVALLDVEHKTERQRAQEGLFLCPGDPELPLWRNLYGVARDARTPGSLLKVVLPSSARAEILADLAHEDMDQARLLPSADEIEASCRRLRDQLLQSQATCGHFRWRLAVKRMAAGHSILEAQQD